MYLEDDLIPEEIVSEIEDNVIVEEIVSEIEDDVIVEEIVSEIEDDLIPEEIVSEIEDETLAAKEDITEEISITVEAETAICEHQEEGSGAINIYGETFVEDAGPEITLSSIDGLVPFSLIDTNDLLEFINRNSSSSRLSFQDNLGLGLELKIHTIKAYKQFLKFRSQRSSSENVNVRVQFDKQKLKQMKKRMEARRDSKIPIIVSDSNTGYRETLYLEPI